MLESALVVPEDGGGLLINGLLAAKAPRLDRTLKKSAKQGGEVVLVDGTPSPPSAAPGRRTARTTPANTTATACAPSL